MRKAVMPGSMAAGTEKLKQQDAKTLKKWLRLAVRADNIGQFENAISE